MVAEWSRYWIVGGYVTSSIPVPPLKTRRVGQQCTLNLLSSNALRWCGSVPSRWFSEEVRRGVPTQMSSSSLDQGSKLRGSSPIALAFA
ncbi:hypothetical protein TNCV_857221, partial [Trichonephila clavipes]